MGARRDAARVRRRLRELGERRRHWERVDHPDSGWSSLTGTERAVCDLVSQGLTNRQAAEQMFVSEHTVAFHLRQIFRKLGVRSRVELARLAALSAAGPDGG
ncbi:helix-turn-helix domain-containing protein [Streptosporangium sandarakinum]